MVRPRYLPVGRFSPSARQEASDCGTADSGFKGVGLRRLLTSPQL